MKLYRGIKTREYREKISRQYENNWRKILKERAKGNFRYPLELDNTIKDLFKFQPLERQNFTDNKEIAEKYAKEEKGLLIEISVPIKEITKHFTLEFQNYAKRRKVFEIVYVVNGSDLAKNRKKWNLKVRKY